MNKSSKPQEFLVSFLSSSFLFIQFETIILLYIVFFDEWPGRMAGYIRLKVDGVIRAKKAIICISAISLFMNATRKWFIKTQANMK